MESNTVLRTNENSVYWRLPEWMSEVSEFKYDEYEYEYDSAVVQG